MTIDQFGITLEAQLEQLAQELAEGRYRCRAIRTVRIPKPDGEQRTLKIACVRDRVVQAACLHLIEPLFDARFSAASFAYRPGRGAHHALALARDAIRSGKQWAVVADIRKCFDTIDHDILLRLVADVIGDREMLQLIRHWLTADVIDFMDVLPSEMGVPQGEAISPLLANIYLDPLDKEFERAGTTFVRYADDYLVLCESQAQAQAALALMTEFLQGVLQLALKPPKTLYCPVEKGISFLGFRMSLTDMSIPAEKVARAMQAVRGHLELLACATSPPMDKCKAMVKMNALVRGFRNYFLVDNAPTIRAQLLEMDAAADSFVGAGLPDDLARDIGWATREKFLPDTVTDALHASATAHATQAVGSYPDDHRTRPGLEAVPGGEHATPESTGLAVSPLEQGDRPAERDFLLADGRLHVMTSGCYVTYSGDDLLVRKRKTGICRVPISDLALVYLEGKGIALSSDLTMRLCEKDVPIVFAPLVGKPAAVAQPLHSTRTAVRQQQVLRRNDPDIIKTGLGMLAAKVANQASLLKYFARYRKRMGDTAYGEVTRCANELREISDVLEGLDPGSASVRSSGMGHEGRAAARYWASFGQLIPAALCFPGRHTHHATDPINSAVNYVYGILYGEVWRAVSRAGLDPYFGIIHGTERDQGSLVFDLIEEYRAPFADRVVLGMLGRGLALDFDKEGRLRTACRAKLATAFQKQWRRAMRWRGKMRSPADILEIQVATLRNTFLGRDQYSAFRFRW